VGKELNQRIALVVDDSMLVRHCVCRFLEQRGFLVTTASNGLEAIEKLCDSHVDLIVTDMQMPQMGGRELIRELKKTPMSAAIPIIVVTGRRLESAQSEDGADYSIYKDIEIENQLAIALMEIFGKSASTGAGK
jgi:CheY-like chemotaxis protein